MAKGDFNRKMAEAMRGRYGADELGNLLDFIAFILLIIDIFVHQTWLLLVALALVVYVGWRMMSKNIEARRNENEFFLDHAGPLKAWLRNPQAAAQEARTYKHAVCPNCGQKVRVPRGKGRLRVTCPKCKKKFEVKS